MKKYRLLINNTWETTILSARDACRILRCINNNLYKYTTVKLESGKVVLADVISDIKLA